MATKEVKHSQEYGSVIADVRATSAVAIWEQYGRKLRRGSAVIAIYLFPNLKTLMGFGLP